MVKIIIKDSSSFNHNDLDELISDEGITYNAKNYNYNSKFILSEPKEKFNEELFEQFKKFILFRKMTENK